MTTKPVTAKCTCNQARNSIDNLFEDIHVILEQKYDNNEKNECNDNQNKSKYFLFMALFIAVPHLFACAVKIRTDVCFINLF